MRSRRIEAALYGAIAIFAASSLTDTVLCGPDSSKGAYIIPDRWQDAIEASPPETARP